MIRSINQFLHALISKRIDLEKTEDPAEKRPGIWNFYYVAREKRSTKRKVTDKYTKLKIGANIFKNSRRDLEIKGKILSFDWQT